MTVVAIWFEPHDNAIWAVGDTRISGQGAGGTLTDGAAKILPLTLFCRQPGPSGDFTSPALIASLGYAYAGSTLGAIMTYIVVNTCLQSLIGLPGSQPPSVRDVAGLIQRVSSAYAREIGSDFESAVFGWCPQMQNYRAITVEPLKTATTFEMRMVEQPLFDTDFFVLLGSHKLAVRTEIEKTYLELQGQNLKRAPRMAIQRLVANDSLPGVGGGLQLGTATQSGFQLKSHLRPVAPGEGTFGFNLLGFSVENQLGSIGSYQIGMTGTL